MDSETRPVSHADVLEALAHVQRLYDKAYRHFVATFDGDGGTLDEVSHALDALEGLLKRKENGR